MSTRNCEHIAVHALTNSPNRVVSSGVLHLSISDHSLIYVIRKIAIPSKTKPTTTTVRQMKHFNAEKFRKDLEMLLSEDTMDFDDPDDMWSRWKNIFLTVAHKHAPPKESELRTRNLLG